MSLLILVAYSFASQSNATPLLAPRQAGQSEADPEGTRTTSGERLHLDLFLTRTILTCLFTILPCLWISVHPNAPSPRDSPRRKLWRRIELVLWALLVPELMVCWAVRQWIGARNIRDRCRSYGWTMAHAHFLQMGGWVLIRPWPSHKDGTVHSEAIYPTKGRIDDPFSSTFQARQVLSPALLDWLVRTNFSPEPKPLDIEDITLPVQVIQAHSSSDILVTSLAVLQAVWFTCQCIAKAVVSDGHVRVLRIELVTASYIMMSLLMYVLWQDKPMDVRVHREVEPQLGRYDDVKEDWKWLREEYSRHEVEEKEDQETIKEEALLSEARPSSSTLNLKTENEVKEGDGDDGDLKAETSPPVETTVTTTVNQVLNRSSCRSPRTAPAPEPRPPEAEVSSTRSAAASPSYLIMDIEKYNPELDRQSKHSSLSRLSAQSVKPPPSLDNGFRPEAEMSDSRRPSLSTVSSFRTANASTSEAIEEVPRSMAPSPESIFIPPQLPELPSPPPLVALEPRQLHHEDASCHMPPGAALLSAWHAHRSGRRPELPTGSLASLQSYETAIFEALWGSVNTFDWNDLLATEGLFLRCSQMIVGPWGWKGYRNAVKEEQRHTGKLWQAGAYLIEFVDRPEGYIANRWSEKDLDAVRKQVANLRGRLPTYYAMASSSLRDDQFCKVLSSVLVTLFGALHLIGWNFVWQLPSIDDAAAERSSTEFIFTLLWRISALIVTVTPIFAAFGLLRLSEETAASMEASVSFLILESMMFFPTVLYIPARILLFALPIIELVRIGERWGEVIRIGAGVLGEWGEAGVLRWTRFIPHLQ